VRVATTVPAEPHAIRLIRELQPRFGVVPILLVSFECPELSDLQGYSEFPTGPYLADLADWNSMEPVEWGPLPELVEEELPF
jgi:hypothetical protein